MSTSVFPSLSGLSFPVGRSPMWKTNVPESTSGKETRVGLWTYPRWRWDLSFAVLREGTVHGTAYTELSQLAGFFNARHGSYDSFLYTDADDNSVTGQMIGTGDGSSTDFQLIRTYGSFIEPVFAPNAVSAVYLDGVLQSPANYSVSNWGSSTPGVLTFTSAPGAGVVVTADFSFYFPCRFTDDSMDFSKFMSTLWEGKKVSFISLKG